MSEQNVVQISQSADGTKREVVIKTLVSKGKYSSVTQHQTKGSNGEWRYSPKVVNKVDGTKSSVKSDNWKSAKNKSK